MAASLARKFLLLPPVLLGGGVLAYQLAFKTPPAQQPPAERARHVRVIEAAEIDIVPRVLGYGSVEPARVWNAVAQVSGRVVFVHEDFRKGAIVEGGTELVRITPKDYDLAVKQAEANIRSAEAKLTELQVGEENTRATLKIERSSIVIDRADAERKRKLLARGTVSQSVVDDEERQLLAQSKKIQDLENSLRLIPTQKAAQEEQKAVYQAELEIARLNLTRTSIRMPFDGRISEQKVEVTQYVGVGETLGAADDIETSEVAAQVPQSQFRRLGEAMFAGLPDKGVTRRTVAQLVKLFGLHAIVRLRFDVRHVEWRGRVVRISDTVDPDTRTIGVIVAVDKAYASAVPGHRPPLVKGMFVEVELRTKPLRKRIVVPRSAVHEGQVYLATKAGRLQKRPVEVGLIQGNQAVLSKGVAPGERIVVSDLSPAIEGMLLTATTDESLARSLVAEASGRGSAR